MFNEFLLGLGLYFPSKYICYICYICVAPLGFVFNYCCVQVTLPCRVHNKIGIIQWTRDGFGLGDTRDLSGYSRYKLIGSDDESKQEDFMIY